jgi:hypothetical protein
VLVHHQRTAPIDAVADSDHGFCERDRLRQVQAIAGAGGDERSEVQVRVAARRDVRDDRAELGVAEGVAIDLGPDMAERIQRWRMGDRDRLARLRTQRCPRRLGQTGDVLGQPLTVDDTERRHDASAAGRQLHSCLGRETFRSTDRTIAPHVDHRLLVGVDARAPRLQRVPGLLCAASFVQLRCHASSTVCR